MGNRDTLTSVAARFDTTPSELTSLNKLNSSFIYAGQQLFVPDKSAASGENNEDGDSSTASTKDSPTEEKTRKLSTEEIQQEEKEKGKSFFFFQSTFNSNLWQDEKRKKPFLIRSKAPKSGVAQKARSTHLTALCAQLSLSRRRDVLTTRRPFLFVNTRERNHIHEIGVCTIYASRHFNANTKKKKKRNCVRFATNIIDFRIFE